MKVIFHSISLFLSCWFPLTANRKPLGTETENCNICLSVLLKHSHVREHVTYYIYVLCCVKHCIDWSTLLFQPCIPYLILHEITFINNGLGILFGITLLWVCIFSLYVSIYMCIMIHLPASLCIYSNFTFPLLFIYPRVLFQLFSHRWASL